MIATLAIIVVFAVISEQGSLTAKSARAESSVATVISSQQYEIDYGEKITVTMTIDVEIDPKDIQSVRALFRPDGGATIWSYSYPQHSIVEGSSNKILVTFDILTGPGSYYPPGAEFDIEIEITDAQGDRVSVASEKPIEYLDPTRDWQRYPGDGYTVVYYDVAESRVEELVATIDHRIPTLEATLGVTDPPNFKAIVFPSIQEATPSFPPVSKTATDQLLFAGFAQPEYRLFVQGQMNSTTFTHELAHLYTHEAVSSSFLGGIPAWLNEGLARFLESGSSERSNARLRDNMNPDDLLSLNHMQTIPGQRSDVFIFYPQAGAFVGYLVEEYSHATMAEFLAELNKGRVVEDAFELIYDLPLHEAENNWRKLFNADALPVPSATVESSETSAPTSTAVPLVDYEAAAKASQGVEETSTALPSSLPTVTPENSPVLDPDLSDDEPDPNYAVAGVVIGLSVLVGVWLFTSRRRMPKRKSK